MDSRSPNRFDALVGASLGLAMLLLVHRYWGIDHDATLYLGQALARRWPENFANDLFFLHGSQANYTLFPLLAGLLTHWIPPTELVFWGGLTGLLLFAAASWWCLRGVLPSNGRYYAWLGVLVLPSFYGRAIIFSYAEPFLTPRPFAEALSLLAIGMLARKRHMAIAAGCLLAAALLHPLQAIAASLVVWPWLVMRNRRWLHALWLLLPISISGLLGIEPMAGLFTPMDDAWLTELRGITGQLFVTGWATMDYRILGFDILLLACAASQGGTAFAQWSRAALAGLALGITASLLLVDGLHLILPTGLQLWRVHWLAHWFAMAALAVLLVRHANSRNTGRALLLSLTALLAWGPIEWAWLPFALLYLAWPRLEIRLRSGVRMLLGALFAAGILILVLHHFATELSNFHAAHKRLDLYALDKRLLAFPVIALGLPCLAAWFWQRIDHPAKMAMAGILLCPFVVLAAARWDIRAPDRRTLDAQAGTPDLFDVHIPTDALVYWDSMSLVGTWSVLQRSDYYDPQQLSGLAFNRGTMKDAVARISRLGPLMEESFACQQMPAAADPENNCRISDAAMQKACGPGPTPKPDFLILPYRQPAPPLGSWTMQDASTNEPIDTFRLYRCSDIVPDSNVHRSMPK